MSVLKPVLNTRTSTSRCCTYFLTCSIEMLVYNFFHFDCKRKGSPERYSIKAEFIFSDEDLHVCRYVLCYCTVFHIKSTISQNYVLSFFLFPELCKLICSHTRDDLSDVYNHLGSYWFILLPQQH